MKRRLAYLVMMVAAALLTELSLIFGHSHQLNGWESQVWIICVVFLAIERTFRWPIT
jgi:hypothetical protein